MAYDEGLAYRIKEVLRDRPEVFEKKMFGGVGFLVQGNMACGVHGEGLIVRVGPVRYEDALAQPHTRPFDLTGRPMKGWVVVSPEGYKEDSDLRAWVLRGIEFALSLLGK